MKNLIKKNVGLIKICFVVLFVALMAFNVVITQNTQGNASVDLSLSGLKAMAFGGGEGGGGGKCVSDYRCTYHCGTVDEDGYLHCGTCCLARPN